MRTEHREAVRGFARAPREGRVIHIPETASVVVVKASGEETGGRITAFEGTLQRGDIGPALHVHHAHDEMGYVLQGDVTFQIGDEISTICAGSFVFIPRGTPHTFSNFGDGPARGLTIMLPGGFEGYYDAMQTLPPASVDRRPWRELREQWDIEVVGPPLTSPEPVPTNRP
jgi:mannose-6-phosphate isomerase-like protein (cupin superfamily)